MPFPGGAAGFGMNGPGDYARNFYGGNHHPLMGGPVANNNSSVLQSLM